MESKKQSKLENITKQNQNHRSREQTSIARRSSSGWMAKQVKGLKGCTLPVIKGIAHRDVIYSTANIVNNIIITLYVL